MLVHGQALVVVVNSLTAELVRTVPLVPGAPHVSIDEPFLTRPVHDLRLPLVNDRGGILKLLGVLSAGNVSRRKLNSILELLLSMGRVSHGIRINSLIRDP